MSLHARPELNPLFAFTLTIAGTIAVGLPMAMTEDLDTRLDFDKTCFGSRQNYTAAKQKAGDGLDVSTAQATAGPKFGLMHLGLRSRHN